MPQTKEEKREYHRQYHIKNREKLLKQKQEYHIKNKDKRLNEMKEYRKTESYKKSNRISHWKYQGVLCFDYNLLNDLFLKTNNCEYCNCELYGLGNNKKCLDHDHSITDKFNIRGVLCQKCNVKDVFKI